MCSLWKLVIATSLDAQLGSAGEARPLEFGGGSGPVSGLEGVVPVGPGPNGAQGGGGAGARGCWLRLSAVASAVAEGVANPRITLEAVCSPRRSVGKEKGEARSLEDPFVAGLRGPRRRAEPRRDRVRPVLATRGRAESTGWMWRGVACRLTGLERGAAPPPLPRLQ